MKNELEELCLLVSAASPDMNASELNKCISAAANNITHHFAQCCGDHQKGNYAGSHQHSMTSILDRLHENGNWQQDSALLPVLKRLKLFYHFLRQLFGRFWNIDLPIPVQFRIQNIALLNTLVMQAKQKFAVIDLPKPLVYVILSPIKEFISNTTICSWKRFKYMYHYHRRLIRLLQAPAITEELIGKFLLVSEFSSVVFLNYFMQYAEAGRPASENIKECILYYAHLLKKVKQLVTVPASNNRKQVRENIAVAEKWMKAEIAYLEKKQKMTVSNNDNKIFTRFSVAELSVGARLLFDAKVFKVSSLAELMRIVSMTISTEGAKDISEGSLFRKAYDCERGTLAHVRQEMTSLIELVKKY